jgi:hypothetical protein
MAASGFFYQVDDEEGQREEEGEAADEGDAPGERQAAAALFHVAGASGLNHVSKKTANAKKVERFFDA